MFDRLRHLLATVSTQWSTDPAARGAAKMTAGAVLVAEGLFGTFRSGRGRSGSGLFGALVGVVVGLVFVGLGQWMAPGFEDQVFIEGRVVDVREGFSDGRAAYSPVYEYVVDGERLEFTSSISSSSRPTLGDVVQIAYSASDPRNAYRADGIDGNFHRIFMGIGGLIAILAFFSLLFAMALVGLGIWLFRQGRRDRQVAGVTGGFVADLISLAGKARAGEIGLNNPVAGTVGPSQGRRPAELE